MGAFGNAAILLFLTFADVESFRSAVFWMMGSLAGSTWAYTVLLGLPLAIGTPLFFGLARSLNLLAVGEATAASLVERARASSARPLDLVAVHLGLSDTARALDWVEQIPGDRGSNFFLLSEPR